MGKEIPVVVMRVDANKKYIDLSRRRCDSREALKAVDLYKKSKVVHGIFGRASALSSIPLRDIYMRIGWPLNEAELSNDDYKEEDDNEDEKKPADDFSKVGSNSHILDKLHMSMHDWSAVFGHFSATFAEMDSSIKGDEGEHRAEGLEACLRTCINHRLSLQPVRIQAEIEVLCPLSNGLHKLRRAFQPYFTSGKPAKSTKLAKSKSKQPESNAKDAALQVRIFIVGSPIYAIAVQSMDKQRGLDAVQATIKSKSTWRRRGKERQRTTMTAQA